MTNEQALQQLYASSRIAQLNADQHEMLRKCAEQIAEALKQLAEKKEE
jgi:predicted metal-dependent hydrolase